MSRGGSRTETSKMERFVIIVNGWRPLTIITKRFILHVSAVLYTPQISAKRFDYSSNYRLERGVWSDILRYKTKKINTKKTSHCPVILRKQLRNLFHWCWNFILATYPASHNLLDQRTELKVIQIVIKMSWWQYDFSFFMREHLDNYTLLQRKDVYQLFFCHLVFHRSSHRQCSVRKGVFRNFTKFTGKHLCQSLVFNKVTGLSVYSSGD